MRSGMPINPLGSGRQPFGKPRNSFLSSLLTKRNIFIAFDQIERCYNRRTVTLTFNGSGWDHILNKFIFR